MEVVHKKPNFEDERGEITDIISGKIVDCVTVLTFKKGMVRGNHYHKKTIQYAYVLKGRFMLFTQMNGEKVLKREINKGDFVITPPMEKHAFEALEDSELLACCSGPRDGEHYEDDTYRLENTISKNK